MSIGKYWLLWQLIKFNVHGTAKDKKVQGSIFQNTNIFLVRQVAILLFSLKKYLNIWPQICFAVIALKITLQC